MGPSSAKREQQRLREAGRQASSESELPRALGTVLERFHLLVTALKTGLKRVTIDATLSAGHWAISATWWDLSTLAATSERRMLAERLQMQLSRQVFVDV